MNETNNIPQIPDTLEPLLKALPDWAGQLIFWVMTTSLALAPFAVWISHWLRDMANRAAESSEGDDDEFLRRLFSNPVYRTVAILLRFVNIHLPTLADLERAITLQAEAVHEAKVANG